MTDIGQTDFSTDDWAVTIRVQTTDTAKPAPVSPSGEMVERLLVWAEMADLVGKPVKAGELREAASHIEALEARVATLEGERNTWDAAHTRQCQETRRQEARALAAEAALAKAKGLGEEEGPGVYFANLLQREWIGPDGIRYEPTRERHRHDIDF